MESRQTRITPGENGKAGWLCALTLALVCLVPPALMLSPPSSGAMLAVYPPGFSPSDALQAASAAGASAAEPLGSGFAVRAAMPDLPAGRDGAAALRAAGAILVIAPLSDWACPPGTPPSTERRS